MELVTKKRLQLFSGRSNLPLAEEIADCLNVKLGDPNLSEFADGEVHSRFAESVRGSDVFIIQSHARPVNDSIMEQGKIDLILSSRPEDRRAIFEETSRHTAIGLEYLPAIARRLHHCRDIGEPFDFLTWFEFAPQHAAAFDELVARLRATPEWDFVEREVDIRLERVE